MTATPPVREGVSAALTVNEIFYSIQGESTFVGRPCVFVRLTACDLRCSWCDTPYAFHEGQKMSVDDVLERVAGYGCRLVEVTGGEPLLQEAVYPLMGRLLAAGHAVLLETGGHLPTRRVPPQVVTILDVKCPGSGEAGRQCWENFETLRSHDQVKFVIQDRADYEYAVRVLRDRDVSERCSAVSFAPVHGVLDPKELAAWILEDRLSVRLQLQVHKYIWGADTRGV